MAQMHPRLNASPSTASNAEKQLYAVLRDKLGDTYHVFHHVERYAKASNGRLVKGETDFVLVHPESASAIVVFTNGDTGMRICERVVTAATGKDQPAFLWL